MPTHDETERFWQDWSRLTPVQRAQLSDAVRQMVDDLKSKRPFRAGLRVKRFQRLAGVYEMTWAPNGRALFHLRRFAASGETHITWLRVGTHDIF